MSELGNTGVATRTATGFMNVLPPGQSKSEVRRHFFSERVAKKWNKLPDTIKQADSVNLFKNRLDELKEFMDFMEFMELMEFMESPL